MKNNIIGVEWFADDAENDKYVSCMSAYLEQINTQGVTVACKWLEVTANLDIKPRWSIRRQYWLLSVRLRYAEWVGSIVHAKKVLEKVNRVTLTKHDDYTHKMYQVLEAACYVALYRISKGSVSTLFMQYHNRLLIIIDDLIALQQDKMPSKSFMEDCGRAYDIVSDIEEICGSQLYKNTVSKAKDLDAKQSGKLLQFKPKNDCRIDNIITYLTQWLGNQYNDKRNLSIRVFLKSLEYAKDEVDRNLGLSTNVLFVREDETNKYINDAINQAKQYLHSSLDNPSTHDKSSFWKLYIDLVFQKAIENMGKTKFEALNLNSDVTLKQASRWPLHEKMHHIISRLARDPDYLENLLEKKIIHSESLLYGIFSTLAMRKIPVVYCGFNIISNDSYEPEFKRHCYNGRGVERIYERLVKLVYEKANQSIKKGFCIEFDQSTGLNLSLDFACICTGKQVVILGIAKDFTLDNHNYQSNREVLGELFRLVGFNFSINKILTISGPSTPETSSQKLKHIEFSSTDIKVKTDFILNYIKQNSPPPSGFNYYPDFLQEGYFNSDSFDEIIEVVRSV